MKYAIFLLVCFFQLNLYAQKPCEYATNVVDSLGSYKATKEYIVHERNFGGSAAYLFFSLVNADGTPVLNFQYIQKSANIIKMNCFDANSKLYLQLENGKVITLIHTNDESCGSLVTVEEEKKYTRLLTGTFMFMKGSMEDLKASPISLLRVKFTTELVDFVFKKDLTSELTNQAYEPSRYFLNFLNCIQ